MDKLKKYKPLLTHPISKLFFGLLPCLLTVFFFFSRQTKLVGLENQALILKRKSELVKRAKNRDDAILEKMKTADRNYVQKELENFTLLSSEIEDLEIILTSAPNEKRYTERLHFLKNGRNSLKFREQNFKQTGKIQEVELIQLHPVEINTKDLQALLHKLEEGKGAPYFVIKHIELIRRDGLLEEETFLLNLELIKYEMSYET